MQPTNSGVLTFFVFLIAMLLMGIDHDLEQINKAIACKVQENAK